MINVPIGELIKRVSERPEGTILLSRAIGTPEKTVNTYRFTPNIRGWIEEILEKVSTGRGGGYWVQAEYGAGKTHFLAVLTCLLMDTSKELWDKVKDEEIKNFRHRLEKIKLFPVILSLKGEAGVDEEDNLLKVIEDRIEESLEKVGLENKISITTEDEVIDWYKTRPATFRNPIDDFIRGKTDINPENLGKRELSQLIIEYCKATSFRPEITTSTKDRISHIYHQIQGQGYQGLLFVIDEFEAWQRRHPIDSAAYAYDEEVLETLSWILPKDLGLEIFTIVASQAPAPAKLRGEKEDRFTNVLLLRDEREYGEIVTERVRELVEERQPEIDQYYEYYYNEFRFLRSIPKEYFYSIFPFQPRIFEAIRRITIARDLPTARLGISVIYEVIGNSEVLSRDSLVTASDLMVSKDLCDAMETEVYREAHRAYQSAISSLEEYDLDEEDKELADKIIKTLFLMFVAYKDTPKALSVQELTEATLTSKGILKEGEDNVLRVLNIIRDLPQVYYTKEKGACFKVSERETRPAQIFGTTKKKVKDEYEIKNKWEEGLILDLHRTGGVGEGLFSGFEFEHRIERTAEHKRIEYPGEIIIARSWREEYGAKLDGPHFRVIFMTEDLGLDPEDIEDPRIAVCVPSPLTNAAFEASWDYLAILKMEEDYLPQGGSEAEEIKEWIKTKKRDVVSNLLNKQIGVYREGKIFTKQSIGIDSNKVFSIGKMDRVLDTLIPLLLSNAYTTFFIDASNFRRKFTSSEAKKVFEGLFKGNKSSSATSACDNFAPGLGLVLLENPREFEPEGNKVFEFIKDKLSQTDEIHIWKLYRDLQNHPVGLTKEIVTLQLLAFIRHGKPACEISLKPMNRLDLPGNRINSFNIPDIEWKRKFEEDFDILYPMAGPGWNDVLPLARFINRNLKEATKPDEIKAQEAQLLLSCKTISDRIPHIKGDLKILSDKFAEPVEEKIPKILEGLEKITEASSFTEFYSLTKDYEDIKDDFEIFTKVDTLDKESTELLNMKSYLEGAVLPEKERLYGDRFLLQQRLKLSSLLDNPSLMGSIKAQFESFKTTYKNLYQRFHRDYFKEIKKLREELESATVRIEAISRLNRITELHFSEEKGLVVQFQDLLKNTEPCPNTDPVSVETSPLCPECKLELTRELPKEETKEILSKINKELERRSRKLAQALTKKILEEVKENRLNKLMKVAGIADLRKFAEILNDELISLVNDILKKANIKTESYPVFENLGKRYGLIGEEKIEEIVSAFKEELEKAFREAKKKHIGKKVRISLR
ncbi:MAG: hypothetical protein U9O41_04710 [Candidatus Aerophobetes bacterium]|nr:hypothetical protein [Candidatus Aerophobetes bacterium]